MVALIYFKFGHVLSYLFFHRSWQQAAVLSGYVAMLLLCVKWKVY